MSSVSADAATTTEYAAAPEAVRADDVSVWFRRGSRDDFRSHVLNLLHGRSHRTAPLWALDGVSFTGFAGEVLGIIGSNGAGKTTICSVIGKVLRPDRGKVTVRGDVSALLSMGTGFNAELTGRENIYMNGLMLGFSRRAVAELVDEIISFAGLAQFADTPVKHYSTGMRSRLGFSIASSLDPEILVLDEALGAGDAEFAERASARLKELVGRAQAVVVVTHNMGFIRSACDRAVWIDGGQVAATGTPEEVTAAYEASVPKKQSRKILTPDYQAPETEVKDHLVARVRDLGIRFKVKGEPFWALKDVSFDVHHGEILGVIGANGAGKTTLCRALSRIYRPDAGQVEVSRRVSALLSMGTGFNKDLPAPENIVRNGLMLGMSKKKMQELTEPILEFAELTAHRDRPVKHLSKGMSARLAFSIAVAVEPSLLIIDEALQAGDLAFKQKASQAMDEMIRKADAVVVVSHNRKFVKSVCTRAVWLEDGQVEFDGPADEATGRYQARVAERKKGRKTA